MSQDKQPAFFAVGGILLTEAESGLEPTCDRYFGEPVHVRPVYGHGWTHKGHGAYPGYPGVPDSFRVRVEDFYPFRNNPRRGFFATVDEPGHPFDGFGMICCTRHQGTFNFTDRPAMYNLLVCPGVPRLADLSDPNCTEHWPVFYPSGDVFSYGFADIAESADHLAKWEAELRRRATGN